MVDRRSEAAMRQAKIAKQQMIFSLRARISFIGIKALNFGPEQDTVIKFTFRNFGGKPGIIDEYCFKLVAGTDLPPTPVYENWMRVGYPVEKDRKTRVNARILPKISQRVWKFVTDESTPTNWLKIYGAVRYQDGFGKQRQSGFLRQYDPIQSRIDGKDCFAVMEREGYNYPG